MGGALEPGYGTNAPSPHAHVLRAHLATSGSLANGPVGKPSRIGSRVARKASNCYTGVAAVPAMLSPSHVIASGHCGMPALREVSLTKGQSGDFGPP
jgi:hypothetical protein